MARFKVSHARPEVAQSDGEARPPFLHFLDSGPPLYLMASRGKALIFLILDTGRPGWPPRLRTNPSTSLLRSFWRATAFAVQTSATGGEAAAPGRAGPQGCQTGLARWRTRAAVHRVCSVIRHGTSRGCQKARLPHGRPRLRGAPKNTTRPFGTRRPFWTSFSFRNYDARGPGRISNPVGPHSMRGLATWPALFWQARGPAVGTEGQQSCCNAPLKIRKRTVLDLSLIVG